MTEPGAILEALRDVVDPEIGINIVDLGLVYDLAGILLVGVALFMLSLRRFTRLIS